MLERFIERITNRKRVLWYRAVIERYCDLVTDLQQRGDKLAAQLPPPCCKHCGSTDLAPDPSGYYIDAERWDGAPLLCMGKCRNDELKRLHTKDSQ